MVKNITVKAKPLSSGKLDNLKKIVADLIVQLVADSHQNDVEELALMKSFESLVAEFNKIITDLTKNIDRIKKQIVEMDLCVKTETAIMDSSSSKKLRNEKLLTIGDKTCIDFLKDFVLATKERYREIESIKDILAIIKRRFGEFPPSLTKKLNDLNSTFKHYINTTQFVKYVEITQSHAADNSSGRKLSGN
jgi:hypothetical protein